MVTDPSKANLLLLNKPFQVMCQFTDEQGRKTLADFVPLKGFYPAGRLDYDSEGLVLLTNDGNLQHRIANPSQKMPKTYWVQVEGEISTAALQTLANGVVLKDGKTRPAKARLIDAPNYPPRTPPVRERQSIPTSWVELVISEGKNRQVRRMTAAVGFPTLRLIRAAIGQWSLDSLTPGEFALETVNLPKAAARHRTHHGSKKRSGNSSRGRKP